MTEERMAVLETQMSQVIKNQDRYEIDATEWRSKFCVKLDRVLERLDNRPCIEHGEKLKAVGVIGNAVWGLILVLIPLLATGAFFVTTMVSDIQHIKSTSYGYRGIPVEVVKDGKGGI